MARRHVERRQRLQVRLRAGRGAARGAVGSDAAGRAGGALRAGAPVVLVVALADPQLVRRVRLLGAEPEQPGVARRDADGDLVAAARSLHPFPGSMSGTDQPAWMPCTEPLVNGL